MKNYTQTEVDSIRDNIRTEERFVAYIVLSSANVKINQMPAQYREARDKVAAIVKKSTKYDDLTKERFEGYLKSIDWCMPPEERLREQHEAYIAVIKDILTPPKESNE